MAAIIAKLYKQIFIVSNLIFMAKKGIRNKEVRIFIWLLEYELDYQCFKKFNWIARAIDNIRLEHVSK